MKKLFLAIFLLFLSTFACRGVDSTAPSGSTLTLTAQPNSIDKNGQVGLTVTGTRANGAPLADDTVVRFTVDASFGVVTPNPVETTDGVAHATFIAGQQSGTALIVASSGEATDEVEIVIGDARVEQVIVTASPSTLPIGGGTSRIRAFVRDENGNPVAGVQVFFQTDQGTLASRGNPVLTNSSGVATDTLTTTETAIVTAVTSGAEGDITVSIAEGEGPTCSFAAPTTGTAGEPIFFVDTSTDPDGFIDESEWNFGDGSTARGLTVTHTYDDAGSFVVVHSVTDNQGFTSICAPVTITIDEGAATPSLSIGDVTGAEASGALNFTISMSTTTTSDVSFTYQTADCGTATANVDYTSVNPTTQTIPAGSSSTTITVAIIDEAVDESTENFCVNLSNAVNATIGDGQAFGTITDDDP